MWQVWWQWWSLLFLKGPKHNMLLWHKSVAIDKISLFSNFQWILRRCVCKLCTFLYCCIRHYVGNFYVYIINRLPGIWPIILPNKLICKTYFTGCPKMISHVKGFFGFFLQNLNIYFENWLVSYTILLAIVWILVFKNRMFVAKVTGKSVKSEIYHIHY